MAKPLTMRIIDAVGASTLPQDLRLLVFALAYLANSKTGTGLSGQDRIGKFMGCTGREVRRKLDRLDEQPDAPVRVIRRHRSRRDGRGRSSDEYQLELFIRTPTSAKTTNPTGRPRPIAPGDQPDAHDVQPDAHDVQPDAHDVQPDAHDVQPDAHVLGSSEKIHGEDPRSNICAPSAPLAPPLSLCPPAPAANRKKPAARKKKPAEAERSVEQRQAHQALTEHYFAEFEEARGSKPIGWGAKEGRAVHELLEKLKYDLPAAQRIVSNGLRGWEKATIMSIASNPSACVAGSRNGGGSQGVRGGDLVGRQMQRADALAADERAKRALP